MKKKPPPNHVVITPQWLYAVLHPRGPWNEGQLALLGQPYPPPPGWSRKIVGTHITPALATQIEDLPYTDLPVGTVLQVSSDRLPKIPGLDG